MSQIDKSKQVLYTGVMLGDLQQCANTPNKVTLFLVATAVKIHSTGYDGGQQWCENALTVAGAYRPHRLLATV